MRQIGWFKHGNTKVDAPLRHWSTTLASVSIISTLLAIALLVFDSWMDALAIYVASSLSLAVMISRLAGQQAEPQAKSSIGGATHDTGDAQPGLFLERTP